MLVALLKAPQLSTIRLSLLSTFGTTLAQQESVCVATFRKRGNKWHVQVRRQGHQPLTRSFSFKSDAEAWAVRREAEMERGVVQEDRKVLRTMTLGDLLSRYEASVTPTKKGSGPEGYRLRAMQAHAVADTTLDKLTPNRLSIYRDERLSLVSAPSVRRELAILQHCLEVARKEWGVTLTRNPMEDVQLPKAAPSRQRRLTPEDLEKLARAIQGTRNKLVLDLINMAVFTGMRRGELLGFTWRDVDADRSLVWLKDTKNGTPRMVPLSPPALKVILRQPEARLDDPVFPMSPNALRQAWERLKRRAGVEDLRFHDLRHEALSRFFELGLSVPEVIVISGHKDARMVLRYTHLRPENVAKRLVGALDQALAEVDPGRT